MPPINITDTASFDDPVTTVATGDPADQTNFQFAPQKLANRTRWLLTQIGGASTRAAGTGVQLLRNVASVAALIALASDLNTHEVCRVDGLGLYHYDAASSATVNSPYVVAPTSVGGGAGRWFLDAPSQGDTAISGTALNVVSLSGAAGTLPIATTAASLQWAAGTTSPSLSQAANTTAAATGQTLSISAQAVSGTGTTTSGSLAFSSGANTGSTTGNIGNITFTTPPPVGAGTFGAFTFTPGSGQSLTIAKLAGVTGIQLSVAGTYFYIGDGTNTVVNLTAAGGAGLQIGGNGAFFNDSGSFGVRLNYTSLAPSMLATLSCTSLKVGFEDNTTNSATGSALTLAGQNATGTTTIGGDVIVTSGTGTTKAGTVHLQSGGTDGLTVGPNTDGVLAMITASAQQGAVRTITAANYTCDASGPDEVLYIDTTSNVVNFKLPPPRAGRFLMFKDVKFNFATNKLNLVQNGTEKIEGVAATRPYTATGASIIAVSNGTDWFVWS